MGLTHLADTSVLIDPPDSDPRGGVQRLVTSVVCVGELQAAVLLARTPELQAARLQRLTAVSSTVLALPVDARAASSYARLRASTRRAPANDLWIAATALAHGLVLLTRDEQLARVPGVDTLLVG